MLSPDHVSAVIVTRGNVDLTPVREQLIFDDIVVLDNSAEPEDLATSGILEAVQRAKHDVIFSLDDDIVHTADSQRRIVSKYRPGVLTGCMWAEWSEGARAQGIPNGYDDLVFYGSGAVYDRSLPAAAASRYLDHHPADWFFRLWFSCIFGVLAPTRQLDVRFYARACAEADYRMCNLPNAVEDKTEAIRRSREIRDWKPDAHRVYLDEFAAAGAVREHRYL